MEQKIEYYLGIEDIVSNAFIEANKYSEERITNIPVAIIEKYGEEVVKKLRKDGKTAFLILSRTQTSHFIVNHQEFLTLSDENMPLTAYLNNGKEIEDLDEKYRDHLSSDVLLAFADPEVVANGLVKHLNIKRKSDGVTKVKKTNN